MNDYELYLEYDPNRDDLASSLSFLSKSISGQTRADNIMLSALNVGAVTARTTLQSIEYSSIRLFLRNVIRNTQEADIRDAGALAYWRQFLIEVKTPFIEYTQSHSTLESYSDIAKLRDQSASIARDNNLPSVAVEGLSDEHFVDCLANYSVPAEEIDTSQKYIARYGGKNFEINRNFKISADQKRNLLKRDAQLFRGVTLILKPKHLYYEGRSMWEFVSRAGRSVSAKIDDLDWLFRFQHNQLTANEFPYPELYLRVRADVEVSFDMASKKKHHQFVITRVLGIADSTELSQIPFEDF